MIGGSAVRRSLVMGLDRTVRRAARASLEGPVRLRRLKARLVALGATAVHFEGKGLVVMCPDRTIFVEHEQLDVDMYPDRARWACLLLVLALLDPDAPPEAQALASTLRIGGWCRVQDVERAP